MQGTVSFMPPEMLTDQRLTKAVSDPQAAQPYAAVLHDQPAFHPMAQHVHELLAGEAEKL